ncbi:MAG: hypothetical protein CL677_09775 [Bdellovibrionaceae bacterium]|nr:hypothetical protein [Pseudobdellovibrionaceae bacterium]|tara:strand:- start:291 stop:617 length:327 start_codon:yes stop_codon:yes gene_type:complete
MKDLLPIKYIGFEPNEKIRRAAIEALDRIERLAPSDSSIVLTVEKFQQKYVATCRVVSISSQMVSESVHKNVYKSLELTETRMLKRIEKWKRKRTKQNIFVSPEHLYV